MLTVYIVRDATYQDDKAARYGYIVQENYNTIASGRIKGHNRADGWRELVRRVLKETNR